MPVNQRGPEGSEAARLTRVRVGQMPCGKYFGIAVIVHAGASELWVFEDSLCDTRDDARRVARARAQVVLKERPRRNQARTNGMA